MGALKGSISFVKFYVEGDLPEDAHQRFMARVRARGFKPLAPEDEGDGSVGWVPIERPLDEDVSFRTEGVFFGAYLNLALRVDKWKFPSTLVKAKMAAAEKAYREKTQKERISRAEKAELREVVERRLRKEGTPITKVVDLSWNLSEGELRFFGRSQALLEHLYELFEKTFQVRLVPAGPYTTALELSLPKALAATLEEVEPQPLHASR